jgi:SAM-dependent methyltransferase
MSVATKLSAFNRERKWNLFLDEVRPTAATTILDVGIANKEFSPVDNFIEKRYPFPEQITALGIGPTEAFSKSYPLVKAVSYGGGRFPFADKSFDVCWSNAVLEHVGNSDKQLEFLKEVLRVSRRAFVTTPNLRFPVEVHTRTPLLHLLPKRAFDRFLHLTGKGWAAGDYMHLLTESALRKLLERCGADRYRLYRNRLAGFTLDFVLIIECNAVPK